MSKYPRKGEFGDTRPRCSWCGRTFEYRVFDPLRQIPYCSYECRMAGMFYLGVCLAPTFTVIASLATIFLPVLAIGFGEVSLLFPVFLWIGCAWFWRGVIVGHRMRSMEVESREMSGRPAGN